MKIAIIGSGISGLSAAYLLQHDHEISVFESDSRIGGHTATKDVSINQRDYKIDTGFIVYNDWTYPNFIALLNELGVENQETEMGFSVTANNGAYEYSGTNIGTLFAQLKNVFSFRHWQMIRDILRFNKEAIADLEQEKIDGEISLGDYLVQKGYSRQFIDYYLVPMGCAIWSASTQTMLEFPLLFFVRFFKNHGLLSVNNRPQWRVIKGGSSAYLDKISQGFKDKIQLNTKITSVTRNNGKATIFFDNDSSEAFDQVIFACHSDQALALLSDASDVEQEVLGAIAYQNNDVVLHTDISLLPKRQKTWSSWNYLLDQKEQSHAVLSYDMNILQGIESEHTFVVTLNATERIAEEKILGQYQYSHPVFTMDAIAAQNRWQEVNGVNSTWFCGAYWHNGFHEDGCKSGIRVAKAIGSKASESWSVPWQD